LLYRKEYSALKEEAEKVFIGRRLHMDLLLVLFQGGKPSLI
jgi:hypothetical protein